MYRNRSWQISSFMLAKIFDISAVISIVLPEKTYPLLCFTVLSYTIGNKGNLLNPFNKAPFYPNLVLYNCQRSRWTRLWLDWQTDYPQKMMSYLNST